MTASSETPNRHFLLESPANRPLAAVSVSDHGPQQWPNKSGDLLEMPRRQVLSLLAKSVMGVIGQAPQMTRKRLFGSTRSDYSLSLCSFDAVLVAAILLPSDKSDHERRLKRYGNPFPGFVVPLRTGSPQEAFTMGFERSHFLRLVNLNFHAESSALAIGSDVTATVQNLGIKTKAPDGKVVDYVIRFAFVLGLPSPLLRADSLDEVILSLWADAINKDFRSKPAVER